jgi:hypothetical protein
LISLAAISRTTLSASGGALTDAVGWSPFFEIATLACPPGLGLLVWVMRVEGTGKANRRDRAVVGTKVVHRREGFQAVGLNLTKLSALMREGSGGGDAAQRRSAFAAVNERWFVKELIEPEK